MQINTQPVKGRKAKEVQAYWKGLKQNEPVTFMAARNGKPLTLVLAE